LNPREKAPLMKLILPNYLSDNIPDYTDSSDSDSDSKPKKTNKDNSSDSDSDNDKKTKEELNKQISENLTPADNEEILSEVNKHMKRYAKEDHTETERFNEKARISQILKDQKIDEKRERYKNEQLKISLLKIEEKDKRRKERREMKAKKEEENNIAKEKEITRVQKKQEKKKIENFLTKFGEKVVNTFEKASIMDELRDKNKQRREKLTEKNQQTVNFLRELRELLHKLRAGVGDDEFNYKEVREILRIL